MRPGQKSFDITRADDAFNLLSRLLEKRRIIRYVLICQLAGQDWRLFAPERYYGKGPTWPPSGGICPSSDNPFRSVQLRIFRQTSKSSSNIRSRLDGTFDNFRRENLFGLLAAARPVNKPTLEINQASKHPCVQAEIACQRYKLQQLQSLASFTRLVRAA